MMSEAQRTTDQNIVFFSKRSIVTKLPVTTNTPRTANKPSCCVWMLTVKLKVVILFSFYLKPHLKIKLQRDYVNSALMTKLAL